jgi:hypothetical protein
MLAHIIAVEYILEYIVECVSEYIVQDACSIIALEYVVDISWKYVHNILLGIGQEYIINVSAQIYRKYYRQ